MASAVVSVTRFLADSPANVIPSSVELAGTIQALDTEVRTAVLQRLERLATGVAVAHGAATEVAIQEGYPVLVNDPRVTEVVRAAVAAGYSDVALVEQLPEMALDDFSVLASEAPGCYFCVGAGDPAWERSFPHHHARFRIDEQSLPIGVAVLSQAAWALPNEQVNR
jgi:amidohydrolase